MGWQENAIMYWSEDGTTWNRISDHNRQPLSIAFERLEKRSRTVGGTLRRYSVAKKRVFTASWDNFPSESNPTYGGKTGIGTVDGGWAGKDIENFYNTVDGGFWIRLRAGSDEAKAIGDVTEEYQVMITDFSKDIEKRGVVDFWSLNITLEEV